MNDRERERAFLEHQRRRFERPDWERYLKPDWRDQKYWNGEPPPDWLKHPDDMAFLTRDPRTGRWIDEEAEAEEKRLEDAAWEDYFALKARTEQGQREYRALLAKYREDQPRVPAGNPDGGQWTHAEGEGGDEPVGSSRASDTDEDRNDGLDISASKKRGHHYVPRQLYKDPRLPDDTRKVFRDAATGPLRDERSNKYDGPHREYNKAVKEHMDGFLERHQTVPEQMTPEHAEQFLGEILNAKDPRIRNYNMRIWLREIMRRVPPRGRE